MNVENEIHSLAGETFAIQSILKSVLFELRQISPEHATAVSRGFERALALAEIAADRHGKSASPLHLTKSVQMIEQLRTAVFSEP